MNRLLAETLNFLNGVIALVLVVGFTLAGNRLFPFVPNPWNIVFGAVIGIVLAAFICGIIAYIALIERHLSEIAKSGRLGSRNSMSAASKPAIRQEPHL